MLREPKAKEGNATPASSSFSTLGDRLLEKHPEVVKMFENLQASKAPDDRLVNVLHDLFPYSWKDPDAFAEGVQANIQGNSEEAVDLFEQLLQTDQDAYPACHLLGYFHGCLGNTKEEVEYYKKAVKINPDYPQVHLSLGVAYWLLGKEKKSLEAFKQSAALAPEFAVADHWFAVCFDRLGRYRSSNGGSSRGMNLKNHVWVHTLTALGHAYIEHKNYSAARHAFKKILQINPKFAEAHFQLGSLHIKKLRNPKRMTKYLTQAEALLIEQDEFQRAGLVRHLLTPKDKVADRDKAAEEWLKEGLRLHKEGRYLVAVDAYRMAIQLREKYLEAYYNSGIAYGCLADAGMENIERAVWAFKDTIRIKPDYIHAHIGLGAAYMKNEQYAEAISILQSAVKLEEKNSEVQYYLGMAYRLTGELELATGAFRTAVLLKPDAVQFHYYLGMTLMDRGAHQEACASLQEAVRIKPDFAAGHYMLGSLYYIKLVDLDRALTHLKKAEKLFLKMEDFQQAARTRQLLMLHPE